MLLVIKAQAALFPPEAKPCISRTRGHDSSNIFFCFALFAKFMYLSNKSKNSSIEKPFLNKCNYIK